LHRHVLVFGLDCASPDLVLDRWRGALPVLDGLLAGADYGPLRTVHPPITVPAWVSICSGLDPGQLGIYGFRSRPNRSYTSPSLHDAASVRSPLLWDLVGNAGARSVVVGFPLSYPVRPVRGAMVAGMLTPPGSRSFTWPESLSDDVRAWAPTYRFDADAHRTGEVERLVEEVFEMTRARFRVTRELLRRESWNFAFVHEIGLDRLQHALWADIEDAEAPDFRTLLDYHRLLDAEIGETLSVVPADTVVLVASDHGARRLEGSFALNEWLREEGYLRIDGPIAPGSRVDPAQVDWTRTRAWADGGYCGRIYLNVRGREPEGAVSPDRITDLRDDLRARLEELKGPDGERLGNAVYTPEEVYVTTEGTPPDLLLYPGDLGWRCAGTSGSGLFLDGNDSGPDAANHAWDGLFLLHDPERAGHGRLEGAHALDVAPTLLERIGLPAPGWMLGGRLC
jgi:predicted AlkP superfamily phosphohydrolase/phosphomutase